MKFHVKIAEHDYMVKKRNAERFLTQRDKVKLIITFRGREVDHLNLGMNILDKLVKELSELGVVEHRDETEAKYKSITVTPKVKKEQVSKAKT